jgi:hypothetical protein
MKSAKNSSAGKTSRTPKRMHVFSHLWAFARPGFKCNQWTCCYVCVSRGVFELHTTFFSFLRTVTYYNICISLINNFSNLTIKNR